MNASLAANPLPGLLPPLHPAADASSMMTGIAVSAILLGVAVSMLAAWLYVRLVNQKRGAAAALRQAGSRIAFRDALLATGTDSVVVLSGEDRQTASADGANALLMTAMRGPDSRRVAAALAALMHEGHSFDLTARGAEPADAVAIRGRMVAGHAVAYAKHAGAATPARDNSKHLEATTDIPEGLPPTWSLAETKLAAQPTADVMDDALAIFAPDGRLVLFNARFAKLWRLSEDKLSGHPHFSKVASLVEGRDGIWEIVCAAIASVEPERYNDWGKARRTDGRTISLSMKRLPNGSTIATFRDLGDRFGATPTERFHVAA